MTYNWDGEMKVDDNNDFYPSWTSPCDGVTEVTGDHDVDGVDFYPKIDSFGLCSDLTGEFVKDGDDFYPRIVLNSEDGCCAGVDCNDCEPALWDNGESPKEVKVVMTGLVACTGRPSPPDMSGKILTQTGGDSCLWEAVWNENSEDWTCRWSVTGGVQSILSLYRSTGGAVNYYFYDIIASGCQVSFTNDLGPPDCAIQWGHSNYGPGTVSFPVE